MIAILRREWVVAWRDRKGFALRFFYGAALLVAGFVLWLALWSDRMFEPDQFAAFGWTFFSGLSTAQFLLASFLGAIVFARTIAKEKESGALDLLLISRLSAFEILLGKALSELTAIAFVLISGVPVLCFLLMLGGVTAGEIVATHAILVGQLLFIAAIALALTSVLRKFHQVMLATLAIVAILMGAGEVWGVPRLLRPIVPLVALKRELAVPGADLAGALWVLAAGGVGVLLAVALGALFLERRLQSAWERPAPLKRGNVVMRALGRVADARALRWVFLVRIGGANPLLAREGVVGERFRIAWLIFAALYLTVVFGLRGTLPEPGGDAEWHAVTAVYGLVVALLYAAVSGALSVVGEKRNGTIEVLLSADVEPREIVEAKLLREALQTGYLLVLPLLHAWIAALVLGLDYDRGGPVKMSEGLGICLRATWAAIACAAFLIPLSVWLSVRCRSATAAVLTSGALAAGVLGAMSCLAGVLNLAGFAIATAVLLPIILAMYAAALRSFRRHAFPR